MRRPSVSRAVEVSHDPLRGYPAAKLTRFDKLVGVYYSNSVDWLKYPIDYGITGLLDLLSLVSITIFVERHLFMKKLKVNEYAGGKTLEGLTWL